MDDYDPILVYSGTIIRGNQIARTLLCPTANIKWNKPSSSIQGVFCGVSQILDQDSQIQYPSCIFIHKDTIEVHLIDIDTIDCYDQNIKVSVLYKIRDTLDFTNWTLQQMQEQIQTDIKQSKLTLQTKNILK